MIRTRFAPSPTGYMHIGNLRTALFEYLIAKSQGGKFVLRIEDTDRNRQIEGAVDVIYDTLKTTGLIHDEGPDVGGAYGPYIQSHRKQIYLNYAKNLVAAGHAYYCFCTKERLEKLAAIGANNAMKYDRYCLKLSKEQIDQKLSDGHKYTIRQFIPEGETSFLDEVFGYITVKNAELDDQILIKSDGMPTYNFANVIDDYLMHITHVVRGNEYISSTPKYVLLYNAMQWEVPHYIHLPLVLGPDGAKLSKRKGDASFQELIEQGFLAEAIMNYIALLGWSPRDSREFFTIQDLVENFDIKGLNKAPSVFDRGKLTWMNGEYFKKMNPQYFELLAQPIISKVVTNGINISTIVKMVQPRINFLHEIPSLIDFISNLPDYDRSYYVNGKMKTDEASSLRSLEKTKEVFEIEECWNHDVLYNSIQLLADRMGVKKGVILWPVRIALSGKLATPCGATELADLLGREESLRRINKGIQLLKSS